MKTAIISLILILITVQAGSQGTFLWGNGSAPTRLSKLDGPLAGRGIWGQFLAGESPEVLVPLEMSTEHLRDGLVLSLGEVSVPGIAPRETAYFQFVAWDGRVWGQDLNSVPENQLGRTDIVPLLLAGHLLDFPIEPIFSQSAIVPPIPEPSTVALLLLGTWFGLISLCWFRHCLN